MPAQLQDLGGEEGLPCRCGVAVGLQRGDRFRPLAGSRLVAGSQGGTDADFEIRDPGFDTGDAGALLAVLSDGDGQRAPGPLEGGRGIPNLLVEDDQGIAVGDLLASCGNLTAEEGNERLEHWRTSAMNIVHDCGVYRT